ncbi:hypothetical protein NFHSH190041_36820 (plasmid) [Shewanella sp. NFH-SH190041]|uniref:hypothetical protein n=1 Tax=Shewanella sp. NFH-SH190041 TaxID=2950245 RepID=UPI0021C3884F|nr:hypothetical protein [Shewanella sp. NFH-SH190041]BDM66230.1 hypothetical protein NFHSH190041_36820 [Shewanella sp. NFH-SH190041]
MKAAVLDQLFVLMGLSVPQSNKAEKGQAAQSACKQFLAKEGVEFDDDASLDELAALVKQAVADEQSTADKQSGDGSVTADASETGDVEVTLPCSVSVLDNGQIKRLRAGKQVLSADVLTRLREANIV